MDELEKIQAQIADLQKKAEEIAHQKKSSVLEEIKAKIKAYGITSRDLGLDRENAPRAVGKVAVKYRKDDKAWTGRGRQPKWVAAHIDKGGKMEDLLVR